MTAQRENIRTNNFARHTKRWSLQSRVAAGTCLVVLMAAMAAAQGLEKFDATGLVHSIPSAPKRSCIPASVYAAPGLTLPILRPQATKSDAAQASLGGDDIEEDASVVVLEVG